MSAPNSPERGNQGEDIIASSEELNNSAQVDELILSKNGQELTSLEVSEFEFVNCREIMYTVLNMCFKVSRYIESYYRYDDVLAVNNDTTQT